MGGTSPNVDYMKLTSVSVYVGSPHTNQVRVAVYQGGALDDPSGATLVYDFGLTSGSATDQFLTLSVVGDIDLAANEVTWIAVKGNDSGFDVTYQNSSAGAGDFQTARGRFESSGIFSNENTAYPSTFPAGGSFRDYWYSFYLTYMVEPPEEPDEPPSILKTEALSEQSTSSATFIDVPNSSLTVTPTRTDDVWLVFVSGVVVRSSSTAETAAEMRLLINGSEVDYWGHQVTPTTTPNGAGFLIFDWLTGVTGDQVIQPQYRAATGTTFVSSLRVVAAKLPRGADFQSVRSNSTVQTTGVNQQIQSLAFTPSSAGNYFVFGKASVQEAPGGSTAQVWVLGADSTQHPNSPSGVHYSNARDCWSPFSTAYRESLGSGAQTIGLRFTSSASGTEGSQHRYRKMMAFREDVWDLVQYDLAAAQTTTTSTSWVQKNSITVPAPPEEREYLVIQSMRISGDTTGSGRKAGLLVEDASLVLGTAHRINRDGSADQGYHHIAGLADVRTRSASFVCRNGGISYDGITLQAAESVIIVFRYPALEGPNSPFFGTVA